MKRTFVLATALLALLLLTSCGGVPLRSVPRLLQLQSQLLEANPAEFMVALQVDARLTPQPGASAGDQGHATGGWDVCRN
jgi:hypothetical protein